MQDVLEADTPDAPRFLGAALLHDLALLPSYAVTDRAVQVPFRGRAGAGDGPPGRWALILRRVGHCSAATGLPADVFPGPRQRAARPGAHSCISP